MPKNNQRLVTALLLACFLLTPIAAQAITAEGVGISPAYPNPDIKGSDVWFVYNLDRGQSVTDYIKLANISSEKTMFVKLYAVDAVVTSQGVLNPLSETDPKTDIGSWVKISESEITLKPSETKLVAFTLTIPENAAVGDHIGAIIAEKGELQPSGYPGLSIKTRVGLRIWNTVPGEIVKKLTITKVTWQIKNKPLDTKASTWEKIKTILGLNKVGYLTLDIKNEGNTHLLPKANIEIKDIFGGWVATLDNVSLGTSFLGQTSSIPVKWEKPILFGWLKAKVTVLYGDNQTATAKKYFWIVPWTIIFLIILLAVIFIFSRMFWRLYYAKSKLKMKQYRIIGKETITDIAQRYNVDWKKLVRINNLKPPFTLKAGSIIFIPKAANPAQTRPVVSRPTVAPIDWKKPTTKNPRKK